MRQRSSGSRRSKLGGLLGPVSGQPEVTRAEAAHPGRLQEAAGADTGVFGDMSIKVFTKAETAQKARSMFCDWRDELTKKSVRQADYAVTVLGAALSWAQKSGHILHNGCQNMERHYTGPGSTRSGRSQPSFSFTRRGRSAWARR